MNITRRTTLGCLRPLRCSVQAVRGLPTRACSRSATSSPAARSSRATSATAWCGASPPPCRQKTGGSLSFEIYPGSSLMKTVAQFSALRRGALDLSLYPLAYAGGEVPEVNIGLMPCLVTTYEQGWPGRRRRSARSWRRAGQARREDPDLGLAGRRRGLPRRAVVQAGRHEGPEDPRRVARDGPDAEGGRRHHQLRARPTRSMPRCRPGRWTRP